MRTVFVLIALVVTSYVNASTTYITKVKLIQDSLVTERELTRWQKDVLYPHLQERWYSKNIEKLTLTQVNSFLSNNENKAAAWVFRPKWQKELVRRQNWKEINATFLSHKSPDLICHFLESQQALNKKLDYKKIKDLWLSGKSRPDHCDPFFSTWLNTIKDSDAYVWERQIKAFYARNGTLLRYLNRFYESEDAKNLGQFLSEVYSDPKHLISKTYQPNNTKMHEIALAAVNRMAFQDPRSASNLWLQIVKATPSITHEDIQKASKYLGVAMAKQALPEASYWLTIADPKKVDETVQHWRLQIALTQKDYSYVIELYNSVNNVIRTNNQWQYWYGVSKLKEEGFVSNDNPLYSLSKKRLYYGYLAAGVLGVKPSLNSDPNYAAVDTLSLSKKAPLVRAKALYEAGETSRAQLEWNLYVRYQDNPTQHAAAELAMDWGWHAKASQSAGWSGRYDLIELRYPEAFGNTVKAQSDELNLPAYWLYGVMRQESRYEHTAVSPAGALGLMQVMPNTAKVTAKKHSIRYSTSADLHEPITNIKIGSHYLSDLLIHFKHPVFATAAYNAGPSRINTWRNRFPNDITIWIESIPFDETRNYVKSVLAYSQIYALKTNENWRLSSWTTPMDAFASAPN
jgi:soluble lytic murein transglycosylase